MSQENVEGRARVLERLQLEGGRLPRTTLPEEFFDPGLRVGCRPRTRLGLSGGLSRHMRAFCTYLARPGSPRWENASISIELLDAGDRVVVRCMRPRTCGALHGYRAVVRSGQPSTYRSGRQDRCTGSSTGRSRKPSKPWAWRSRRCRRRTWKLCERFWVPSNTATLLSCFVTSPSTPRSERRASRSSPATSFACSSEKTSVAGILRARWTPSGVGGLAGALG